VKKLWFIVLEALKKTLSDIRPKKINPKSVKSGKKLYFQFVRSLLSPQDDKILSFDELAARLQRIIFQFLSLNKINQLWVSPLVTKGKFAQ
jgi:hypothetical protein